MNKIKNYFFAPRFHFNRFQFNLAALIFAVFGFLFATYFATVKLPQVFALNDTSKTWTFTTDNAGQFTYDTSLVTVDGTAHPVTGVNKVVNPAFSSDTSSWSLSAVAGSTTPAGWVVVPGNTTYSTTDFLSMKYEAKCAATSDLTTGLTSPDSGYHTYSDSGTACTAANSKGVVSVASGYPIANITQTNSIARCAAVTVAGGAAHLITNNEWMTIARNAASMASNWANGTIGSTVASGGGFKRGNVGITDSASYNGSDPEKGTGRDSKAKLVLSNGQEIWDISGNVWEHVNFDADKDEIYDEAEDLVSLKDEPEATDGASTRSGWEWSGFSSDGLTWYLANNGSGPLNYDVFRPFNSSWNANYGVVKIYHYSDSSTETPTYVFIRGGYWGHEASAGVFLLYLGDAVSHQDNGLGLRCARYFSTFLARTKFLRKQVCAKKITDLIPSR